VPPKKAWDNPLALEAPEKTTSLDNIDGLSCPAMGARTRKSPRPRLAGALYQIRRTHPTNQLPNPTTASVSDGEVGPRPPSSPSSPAASPVSQSRKNDGHAPTASIISASRRSPLIWSPVFPFFFFLLFFLLARCPPTCAPAIPSNHRSPPGERRGWAAAARRRGGRATHRQQGPGPGRICSVGPHRQHNLKTLS